MSEGTIDAGRGVRRASWAGTVVFAVTAMAGVVLGGAAMVLALTVAATLFVTGGVVFSWAYLVAVRRSRREVLGVADLYLLAGAPGAVRRSLLGSLAAQVVLGLATAGARPYTSMAAGTLVPLYGLALCGLWAARHGDFPRRQPALRPPGGVVPGPTP